MYYRNISRNKIFAHFDRIESIYRNNICFPVCLEIHATNVCTHACNHCSFSFLPKGADAHRLDKDLVFRVVCDFKKCGGKAVLWSGGGEPTSYRSIDNMYGIKDLIEYTHTVGLDQGIYTNGEGLDDDIISTVIQHCKFIRISLDAFSPETHEKIHNTRSFEQILHNIEKCVHRKKLTGSKIVIGISYLLYDNNIDDIVHYEKFYQTHNIDYIYFKPGIIKNITPIQKVKCDEAVHILCEILGDDVKRDYIEIADEEIWSAVNGKNEKPLKKCYMGSIFPLLAADGKLYYCCHSLNKPGFCLGDLTHERFQDIYSRLVLNDYNDFQKCPIICRGYLINQDVDNMLALLSNEHCNFL